MALVKVNYVPYKTKISAKNLNDIQDALIALENKETLKIGSVSLPADKWVANGENLHSQVVQIPNVTACSQVDLTPSVEQLSVFHNKDLAFVTGNTGGVVTVYAIGQKPTNDYTIQVTIKEVSV